MQRQKIVHNKILDYAYSQELCVYKDQQVSIYKGHHIPTSQPALVKIVDIKHMKPEDLTQYINNLKAQKLIENESISRIMDIANTPANLFIMYEYHEINLQQILSQGKVSEQQAIQLFEQIIAGVLYLHNKNISHRSLSCSNIMIKQGKNALKIKLVHPNQNEEINSKHKDCYLSPQNLFKKVIGTKGDIWSLGVVYFLLLNGDAQTKSLDLEQFHKFVTSINTYKQMVGVSNWSKNILVRMLVVQPDKRADIHQIALMTKSRGETSAINYQPIAPQQHSSETNFDLPLHDIKPSTGFIPTSPQQTEGSLAQYHRSPLKYVNKSPIRRNQSFQTNNKSPMAHHHNRQMTSQINIELKIKVCFYFDLAIVVQRLLFVFNQAKTIYEQAVRITLLTLKHFSDIVKEIIKLVQNNRHILTQQQNRLLKAFDEKINTYELSNTKKMQHDTYFTHLLSNGKQSNFEFLNYIQFWLRLAIRHTIDFVQINKQNLIDKNYLQCIYWSYLYTLKYYYLLDWLKIEKRGNKIPEFYIDKILSQRQEISVDLFKLTEEQAMKILKI